MSHRIHGTTVLVLWGLLVAIGGIVLYNPLNHGGLAGELRWLVILASLLIGAGLVGSGILMGRQDTVIQRQTGLPASILVVIGLVGAVGSIPIFRPWQYDGLAGELGTMILIGAIVGGVGLVAAGLTWSRSGNERIPLVVLAGLCGVGAFYPLDDAGLLRDMHPLLYLALVAAFVGVPLLGVLYGWPRISYPNSTA